MKLLYKYLFLYFAKTFQIEILSITFILTYIITIFTTCILLFHFSLLNGYRLFLYLRLFETWFNFIISDSFSLSLLVYIWYSAILQPKPHLHSKIYRQQIFLSKTNIYIKTQQYHLFLFSHIHTYLFLHLYSIIYLSAVNGDIPS